MHFARLLAALLVAAPLSAQQRRAPASPAATPPDLDATVQRAITTFQTPGIAIAIVKDGQIVLTKGWGVRQMGHPEPVTERTLFGIASNTKHMTSAALAMLVDSGRVHWKDRVIDYLPWFAMSDPYVTREMTIEDLLVHRSGLGLGAGDLLWFHTDLTRREIVERLRYVPLATSFRSAYAYDNVLYNVAGLTIEAIAGMPWDSFVTRRIFRPLGMTSTNTSITAFRPGDDIAWPHAIVDGRLAVVPFDSGDNIGPAGSVNSNVADMARWVRVLLDSGRIDDTHRLWSAARTGDLWFGRTNVANPRGRDLAEYALGTVATYYRGTKILTHTGGLAGMISRVWLIPRTRTGFVILTNAESSAMDALTNYLRDYYMGADSAVDYIARFSAPSASFDEAAWERHLDSLHVRNTSPSLPLGQYAGTYHDAWYGDVRLTQEESGLVIRFPRAPAFTGDLTHWHHDTFRVRWRVRNIPDAWVQFQLNPQGSVERVKMSAVSPSADFSFDWQDLDLVPVRR